MMGHGGRAPDLDLSRRLWAALGALARAGYALGGRGVLVGDGPLVIALDKTGAESVARSRFTYRPGPFVVGQGETGHVLGGVVDADDVDADGPVRADEGDRHAGHVREGHVRRREPVGHRHRGPTAGVVGHRHLDREARR